MAKQSPLQIMLNKALGVIQKGKKHIIETTRSNELKKREAKKGALSSIFGRGVVDDVYTKANQITQAGKQAFTERLQSPAPVRMNAKETLVTKPLKVTKDLAQGIAYGAGFLTKSAVQAVGGDKLRQKYDNPEMETKLFGRPTKTLQDFSKQTGKYAEEKGSSPRQKATLQGLAIAGSLFVENPLNFSKTPAKKLFTELAQETNEQVIKQQVRDNFVDLTDDMIESIAPRITKATNEKEVVDIINRANIDPLNNIENDLPKDMATNAYRGTSFNPEKRGQTQINDYIETLNSDYNELLPLIKTPEEKQVLDELFTKYRDGYKKRSLAQLKADSRTMSSMITGPARFPVSKNRDRYEAARKVSDDKASFREYTIKKIKSQFGPKKLVGTGQDVIDAGTKELADLKSSLERMKNVNKIIRKGQDVNAKLSELGFDQEKINLLKQGDFAGRKGFAPYEITNLNAKIKAREKNIEIKTKKREIADTIGNSEEVFDGGMVVKNFENDRIQIIFDEKPNPEMISLLKSKGYKWSPTNNAWQRILTNRSIYDTQQILKSKQLPIKQNVFIVPEIKPETPQKSIKEVPSEPKKILTSENIENGLTPKQAEVIKKQVKPVDRLIAEGKIRVVSRDGRDVYQTKQRGMWVNARDEESAVAKVTKTAVEKPKAVIPEKLENERMMIEFQKDELKRDPARTLTKYMNKNGELPEVSGSGASKFARKGDDIAKELGFEDSESARIAAQEYLERKKTILAEEKALKQEIKEVKKKSPIEIVSEKRSPKPRITPEEVKSIEKQAQQAQEIMDSDFRKLHDVSLPTIVKQTVTPVTRKVHLIDTLFTTPKFVMEKIGFGKEVKELRRAMDNYWKELPKNLDVITDWSKRVSKESNQKIFRYLDGQKVALNPKELEVAGEIKVWLKQWADRLGLKEENRVTDYITRLFDNDLAKEFDEELAKIIADKIPGSVYSPFVLKRLGAKGYIEDTWKALDAYVKRSTRKVHMDPVLDRIQTKTGSSLEFANIEESQFRYIQKYIENINMRPTNVDKSIDNFIKNIPFIGNKFGQRPVTAVTKFFRQMTYRGMLGLNPGSAIRNLSQGINTYATIGEKYTVLGYAKLFNKGSMKELIDEGVLNAGFVQDKVLSATKKKIEMLDKGLFAMFETVERINRGAAYFGAKSKALKEGKSLDDAIEYAKDIVRKTQFVFDSVDSPVGMSSDIMKTLFQFQTFTTKQIEFLGGMIKDKNVKGLTRYTLAGLAFVYTIGQAIGMEPKEILPMYRFKTPPSLKFPVEVAKAGLDAPDKYGKDRDLKTKLNDIGKSGVGLFPGGTQIKKTLEGLGAIKDGGSFDKAGRLQFEIGDTKKDKIQAILFGKYPTKEAKEYFDKIESGDKVTKKDKKLYEAIQEIKATDPEQALESYKNLTDEEKASYQAYKKQLDTEKKTELKKNIFPVFQEIRKLKEEGKEQEALDAYKALTPEEKETYQSIKKSMENLDKQEEKAQAERTFVKLLVDYTRAYAIDPSNAFKAMTTKEKLGKVEGKLVGFERFFGKQFNQPGGSEEYMYKLLEEMGIPASERSNYNLEHIVPLTAGGDNSPENLKVVDRATHNSWTEIDIALGKALKDKKINRKRAEKIAIDFKSGLINKEEVLKLIK